MSQRSKRSVSFTRPVEGLQAGSNVKLLPSFFTALLDGRCEGVENFCAFGSMLFVTISSTSHMVGTTAGSTSNLSADISNFLLELVQNLCIVT
jgi:hypothetical protein